MVTLTDFSKFRKSSVVILSFYFQLPDYFVQS